MQTLRPHRVAPASLVVMLTLASSHAPVLPHGTVVTPVSRVYRVFQSNPQNPNFPLAANAVAIDGSQPYYDWNEVSRNIPQAVQAGLPAGFDYSPWMPDGQLASAGRVDPTSTEYSNTFAGLDQVSVDWPTTPVTAGETLAVSFFATAPHNPSVWDVWMTTPDWDPATPLRWSHMEFLGRPTVAFSGSSYDFDVDIPADRSGHHVLWVAWQRDDPVGEVFVSTSDVLVRPANDACADAEVVELGNNGTFGLAGATATLPAASCEPVSNVDMWFRHTATCAGTLRADTCAGPDQTDTTVSIWSGSCGALTEVGCDANGCGVAHSAALANVVSGADYWIKVSAPAGGASTTFDLSVSFDNNTGSVATVVPGCSAASIQSSGAPNLGGIVSYSLEGGTGLVQAILLGFTPSITPVCTGCTVGPAVDAMMPNTFTFVIPCDSALVGVQWWVQGIDALGGTGAGGVCSLGAGVDFTLTDTLRTQVGS
ncbi:MAG: lytic polysaccharide monooxygenase [Planctomycetota bacterium]